MPQPNLRELQSWLRWIITDPRGVPQALQNPHPDLKDIGPFRFNPSNRERCLNRYRAPAVDCLLEIQDDTSFRRQDRLSVYAEAYFTRISQSLAEDFASVKRLVGEEGFDQLVTDYLKEYPSPYENLAEIGRSFPTFLNTHEAKRGLPYIVDLAELEWKIIEAFHVDDSGALDPEELKKIAPEQWPRVTFVLDPSLRLLSTPWDIDLFWSEDKHEISQSHRDLRVFRENGQVLVESIEQAQVLALEMATSGRSLGEICARIEEAGIDQSAIQRWFADWIQRGIIREVKY